MTLITGFTCPPTIYFKFITKCDKCYYKVRWSVITKCDSFFITKCDKCYYKVRQVLQGVTILLQSATIITKCDSTWFAAKLMHKNNTSKDSDRRNNNNNNNNNNIIEAAL